MGSVTESTGNNFISREAVMEFEDSGDSLKDPNYKLTQESSNDPDTSIKKKPGGIIAADEKGRHEQHAKIPEFVRQGIRDHIMKFPVEESHSSRERSGKKYLGSHLNISKMYRLYKTECEENNVEETHIAKEWLKTDNSGNNFDISKIVHLQVKAKNYGTLYYKTSFDEKEFTTINLIRPGRRATFPEEIPNLRSDATAISTKKYKHLQTLLKRHAGGWMRQSSHDERCQCRCNPGLNWDCRRQLFFLSLNVFKEMFLKALEILKTKNDIHQRGEILAKHGNSLKRTCATGLIKKAVTAISHTPSLGQRQTAEPETDTKPVKKRTVSVRLKKVTHIRTQWVDLNVLS
ncbi:hypothetical protein ILUMI_09773 [Ignelater luminosus]|uniref:Uncharacterized protein n=1 Tax=Ignelater luminosus TaxID=2038154 RepID=A0A8K0D569_IGNLU|nr:hypothetical protein ILUMI_09773 [Ignelater luminosus]